VSHRNRFVFAFNGLLKVWSAGQNTLTCQCAQTSIVHYSFIQYFFIYWMLVACTLFFLPNIWLCCTWWVATITIYLYPVFD